PSRRRSAIASGRACTVASRHAGTVGPSPSPVGAAFVTRAPCPPRCYPQPVVEILRLKVEKPASAGDTVAAFVPRRALLPPPPTAAATALRRLVYAVSPRDARHRSCTPPPTVPRPARSGSGGAQRNGPRGR